MTKDRVIGGPDGLPWNVPDEYRHFLDSVSGQTVLFGRRSHEIFRGGLTAAHCVVLSRSRKDVAGATVCGSFSEGLAVARSFGLPVWCCGGANVYAQAIPHADEMHLSTIRGTYAGNAYFPEFNASDWQAVERADRGEWEFVRWVREDRAMPSD